MLPLATASANLLYRKGASIPDFRPVLTDDRDRRLRYRLRQYYAACDVARRIIAKSRCASTAGHICRSSNRASQRHQQGHEASRSSWRTGLHLRNVDAGDMYYKHGYVERDADGVSAASPEEESSPTCAPPHGTSGRRRERIAHRVSSSENASPFMARDRIDILALAITEATVSHF